MPCRSSVSRTPYLAVDQDNMRVAVSPLAASFAGEVGAAVQGMGSAQRPFPWNRGEHPLLIVDVEQREMGALSTKAT